MKLILPAISPSALNRPLSLDPSTEEFVYYEKVQQGEQKIVPIEQLNQDQLLRLIVERQFHSGTNHIVTLGGRHFTREQLIQEIKSKSKIGKQIFDADVNYLKFYLSSFPPESFNPDNPT